MKVLMINGSARENGNTAFALGVIARELEKEGIESEIITLGKEACRDCIGCGVCRKAGKCVFDDDIVNRLVEKGSEADGFIFGTPIYYAHPSGRILSILDRMFYSGSRHFAHKPAAAIAVARRAGTSAGLDVLNKYFTIAEMPVVSSTYWNCIHGALPGEAERDPEGIQTMKNLALNMAWLMKSIACAKQNGITAPESSKADRTNFIR